MALSNDILGWWSNLEIDDNNRISAHKMKSEAHKKLTNLQTQLETFKKYKRLSPEPFIVDQLFHLNNPTFFADLDYAERMFSISEQIDDLMKTIKNKNTKEDYRRNILLKWEKRKIKRAKNIRRISI